MDMDDYQAIALKTADLDRHNEIFHLVLGLAGESGEISEKFKKLVRDNDSDLSKLNTEDIKKELGDVLWYVTVLSKFLGFDLKEVAKLNNEKLLDRLKRDTLKGSGDNR